MSTQQPTMAKTLNLLPYHYNPKKTQRIKQFLMKYLLCELHQMEHERKQRVNSDEFADFLLVPRSLIARLLDPYDLTLPHIDLAERLAITLQSNEINRICEYPDIDENLISLMYHYKQLSVYQKGTILDVLKPKVTQDAMPSWYKFGKK